MIPTGPVRRRVAATRAGCVAQPGDVVKLEQFVKKTQPDVIVLGAKDVRCRTLKEQLDAAQVVGMHGDLRGRP